MKQLEQDVEEIGLKWRDHYALMQQCGMKGQFAEFTAKLEQMYQKEFPDAAVEIKWLDNYEPNGR